MSSPPPPPPATLTPPVSSELPVFSRIDPPAGTSTITYTIFGELLNQVVTITTTIGSVDVTPNILSRNSSEIQFIFGNISSSFPAIAVVSLQLNNSICRTLSQTVSLHHSRKYGILGVASAAIKLGLTTQHPLVALPGIEVVPPLYSAQRPRWDLVALPVLLIDICGWSYTMCYFSL